MPLTDPIDASTLSTAPRLAIAPSYTDPKTGALYVHESLYKQRGDWEAAEYVGPIKRAEQLGDTDSFAAYLLRFGEPATTLITWTSSGLSAVLDFHSRRAHPDGDLIAEPNRCTWTVDLPFTRSSRWVRWERLANGAAMGQKSLIEALEDLAEDIVEPPAADIVGLLRALRSTVLAEASSRYNEDGSSELSFKKSATVNSAAVTIPPHIAIAIPVLKGHTVAGADGRPSAVLYSLAVRIRVGVDDQERLTFRLSIPNAENALEAAVADRVDAARAALGDDYSLLRGAS